MREPIRRAAVLALGLAIGMVAGWVLSRTASARTEGEGRLELAVVETFNSLEALTLLEDADAAALEAQLHRDLEFALSTSELLLDRGVLPREPLNMNWVMDRYALVLRRRPDLRHQLEGVVARLAPPPWR